MDLFSGVGVALVTLLDDTGSVDAAATGSLAADLAGRGMKAVLACGTTGEAGALTDVERVDVIRAVRDALPPDIQVLAGTGATDPAHAAELTRAAVGAGADAVLAWPPPRSHDLAGYFGALGDAADGRPVLGYHIPWISSPGIPVSELAGLPIAGLKDSSGDPDRLLAEVARYSGRTYVGSSALLALAGPLGAAGAILAVANVEPELCIAAFGGDAKAQGQLTDIHLAVREGGVPVLKQFLADRTGTVPLSRLTKQPG